jgi:hypothetical protein
MISKTITFENFLGEKETETFLFNMSKGELVQMQMAAIDQKTESFQDKLEKIGKNLNGQALIDVVDEIVLKGYGERTTDGKRFIKNAQLSENFKSSGAYSELIVELCTDADAMAAFVNGLMPTNLRDTVNKEVAASQSAREKSLAGMQGFRKAEEKPKPTLSVVPDLPVVIEGTADPVLEPVSVPVEQNDELAKFRAWQEQQKGSDQ